MSKSYYVLPLTYENYNDEFYRLQNAAQAAITDSRNRVSEQIKSNPMAIMDAIDTKTYIYVSGYRRSPDDAVDRHDEYEQYPFVLFFNEAAMLMFHEAGVEINAQKIITEDQLPRGMQLNQDPYLPKRL